MDRNSLIVILFLSVCVSGNKTEIRVGVICTMSNHWWIHAKAFPGILQTAFDDIDNATNILSDYRIILDVADDQGLPGLAMKGLFYFIQSRVPIHMLLGPTKSEATYAVSQVAPVWNLMSVLYSARSSDITDRSKYKNTFVLNPIDNNLNHPRIAILKYFGWSKQMADFHEHLKRHNMTLLTSVLLTENDNRYIADRLVKIKETDARIIIANINDMYVRQVFCEASRLGLTGAHYVWILINWALSTDWPSIEKLDTVWDDQLVSSRCTTEQLVEASQRYLGLSNKHLSASPDPTISGKTPREESQRMHDLYAHTIEDGELPYNYPNAIDAAWTVGLALNASVGKLKKLGRRLEEFTYSDREIAEVMRQSLEEIRFDGVSGPVSFREDGSRIGTTYITQWRGHILHEVGEYIGGDDELVWYKDNQIVWPDGKVVRDSFVRIRQQSTLPDGLRWSMVCLAIFGLILTAALLTFNVYKRNDRHIKMSSPNLNNLIISGAAIMYIVVVVSAIDRRMLSLRAYERLCLAKPWLISIAFTLAFGSMFTKTWRVHRIFINEKHERRVIKDSQLFGIIALLLACDILVLVLWTVLHPQVAREIQLAELAPIEETDVIIVPVTTECNSPESIWYQTALYIYKGLLLVLGSFIAFETRHVNYPDLNDSKSIGICVYNVTILCAFAVPLNHVLNHEQESIRFALIASLVIFCTTSTLALLFFNKVAQRNTQVNVMRLNQSSTSAATDLSTSHVTKVTAIRMSTLLAPDNGATK